MASEKILIVDDDVNICELLRIYLEKEGFTADVVTNGLKALETFNTTNPDLVLLDIMLPGIDGWQICREIRKTSQTPIIMLTAKGETFDKVLGLELGADDYITKPFSIRELMARVKANMRRAVSAESAPAPENENTIRRGALLIDTARHAVFKNGRELELTQREYELIKFLAAEPGKVIPRQELMTEVWQYDYYGDLRAVDVAVRRLREKLEDNPAEPTCVLTKRGVGYYFQEPAK